MRFVTFRTEDGEEAGVYSGGGVLPIADINRLFETYFPTNLFDFISENCLVDFARALAKSILPDGQAPSKIILSPPYRRPGKIWGIGLNYQDHARDLSAPMPDQPASFMKPATAIIGPGESIRLPEGIGTVTAEAELGVIIGQRCRHITADEARNYIFGYTTILDMTALDILQQNPRYLTRAKSHDTFFSFGPQVLTTDEILEPDRLTVRTIINGEVKAANQVANMRFSPFELVAYHSKMMTLEPGDIISTGTPGAHPIVPGDEAKCDIDGFEMLVNPVRNSTPHPD